jgi:hypothetical protein
VNKGLYEFFGPGKYFKIFFKKRLRDEKCLLVFMSLRGNGRGEGGRKTG